MHVLRVYGTVQGVGFRPYVWRLATELGLSGSVRNMGSYVEIVVDGPSSALSTFLKRFPAEVPPHARINAIESREVEEAVPAGFAIAPSCSTHSSVPSGIPPDLALCEDCRRELHTPGNRRAAYPFINCTACGPRFTIVRRTPYDRAKTSMDAFALCEDCRRDYEDPQDRRYHAEPIACPACGPAYSLLSGGDQYDGNDAFSMAASLLSAGASVAIKGYGGFHLACDASSPVAVASLRRALGRPYQPFAVMARNLEVLDTTICADEGERSLLSSAAAPIVVLPRCGGSGIDPGIAPGLDTVGIILPYAPVHELLFSRLQTDFLVMTSANYPGNPMVLSDEDVARHLPCINHVLTHNLAIVNRCDDSVIRSGVFIRRSRGHVPAPLPVPAHDAFVAFGAELNNVMAASSGGSCLLTQHIGDTSNWDVLEEGMRALDRIMVLKDLRCGELSRIMCDLHPSYHTVRVAEEWARDLSLPLYRIQHHEAHAYAIVGEYGLDEALCITIDGTGHGRDGAAWGGELFYATGRPEETLRLGHQEYLSMPGGDKAAFQPLRILIPLLGEAAPTVLAPFFAGGRDEVSAILAGARLRPYPSSSCGRVLDAASALLGLAYERTYEGEGPMRLEACARRGTDLGMAIEVEDNIMLTGDFLRRLAEERHRHRPEDLAMTVHCSLARGYLSLVDEHADLHLPVGLSGGAAINTIISRVIRSGIEERGRTFLPHRLVPSGDGGIAYGQACVSVD